MGTPLPLEDDAPKSVTELCGRFNRFVDGYCQDVVRSDDPETRTKLFEGLKLLRWFAIMVDDSPGVYAEELRDKRERGNLN